MSVQPISTKSQKSRESIATVTSCQEKLWDVYYVQLKLIIFSYIPSNNAWALGCQDGDKKVINLHIWQQNKQTNTKTLKRYVRVQNNLSKGFHI